MTTLERWEEFGAVWRVVHLSATHAEVDLCTCAGEPVERLSSGDPGLLAFLRRRGAAQPAGE